MNMMLKSRPNKPYNTCDVSRNSDNICESTVHQLAKESVDAGKSVKTASCVLCKKTSVCVCQRCGDYYCSPDCQRKDWPCHRYICFAMPPLVRACSQKEQNASDAVLPVLTAASGVVTMPAGQQTRQMHKIQTQQKQSSPESKDKSVANAVTGTGHRSQVQQVQMPTSPMPKQHSRVLLTGFRTPNRCYVRSLVQSENERFMQVAKAVDAYGKVAAPLNKLPVANSYAISHMDQIGIMYRVQVLAVRNAKNIRVLFCDYGTTAVRQLSDLREISDHVVGLQQHTVQLQLKNVENYELNEQLTNFLSQFEDMEFKIQYCNSDERGGAVMLSHWQSEECLNEQISQFAANMSVFVEKDSRRIDTPPAAAMPSFCVELNHNGGLKDELQINRNHKQNNFKHAEPTRSAKQVNLRGPTLTAPFALRTLTKNVKDVEVFVVDNSCLELGYFGCIERTNVQTMVNLQDYMTAFQDSGEAYRPSMHEYCIAKFEGDWYRARVTSIPNSNEYTVVYIDYTNEGTITSEHIRPYPPDLKIDCATNLCLIDGLPTDIDAQLAACLKKHVPVNKIIKIDKVKAIDDQIIIVEMSALIQKLQKYGFK